MFCHLSVVFASDGHTHGGSYSSPLQILENAKMEEGSGIVSLLLIMPCVAVHLFECVQRGFFDVAFLVMLKKNDTLIHGCERGTCKGLSFVVQSM